MFAIGIGISGSLIAICEWASGRGGGGGCTMTAISASTRHRLFMRASKASANAWFEGRVERMGGVCAG